MYKDPDVVATVNSRRLNWDGQILLRGTGERTEEIWRDRLEGTRLRGRPNLRWSDQVKKDFEASSGSTNDRWERTRLAGGAKN